MSLREFVENNWYDENGSYVSYVVDDVGYSEGCFICYKEGVGYICGSESNGMIWNVFNGLYDLLDYIEEYGNGDEYEFEIVDGEVYDLDEMLKEMD